MADLIEEERRIILDNPLGHSLDSVREALRNAEEDAQGEAFEAERSGPWLEAVSKLYAALHASRACQWLANIDIWTAVIAVIATLNKDTLATYRPLSWLPFK
ncbi:hypothetical protein E4U31_008093 [Claviceps sp. LM219 group G6]|nr:hypothetical protein E4U31_008093 [Claviceps sp. LM219 group G6]